MWEKAIPKFVTRGALFLPTSFGPAKEVGLGREAPKNLCTSKRSAGSFLSRRKSAREYDFFRLTTLIDNNYR